MKKTLLAMLVFIFAMASAHARSIEESFAIRQNQPIFIQAMTLLYDKEKDVAYAKGNVQIEQGKQVMVADEFIYIRGEDVAYAKGNVALRREDGSVFFTDEIRLEKSLMRGVALNFKARMGVKSLLVSSSAELIDANKLELKNMAYTPCKVCASNLIANTPLWQFKAKKALLNREEQKITYNDATIEALGVPIAYTPYLISPSPGATKKSGFLMPRILLSSSQLGFSARIPYYQVLARNMDITVTPFVATKASDALFANFRHKIKQGEYELGGSFTSTTKSANTPSTNFLGKRKLEGHYDVKGDFYVENQLHGAFISAKSMRVFDKAKTYLKKYRVTDEQVLTTDLSYNVYEKKNWYILRALGFQDLRPMHNNKTTPSALPFIDMHYENNIRSLASLFQIDFNFLNLHRPQGANYQRFVTIAGITKQTVLPYGHLFKVAASIRGDLYYTKKKSITVTDTPTKLNNTLEGYETRGYPELNAEWSFPMYRTFDDSTTVIFEPVVNGIVAPYTTNLEKVGDEDSKSPEISAYNLFSKNRYKGYDKIESGSRLNYGIRANIISRWMHNLNFLVGQSIRAKNDNNFQKRSGLDGKKSDYVTKVSVQPTHNIFINNNSRYDEENVSLQRNELSLDVVLPSFNFKGEYNYTSKDILDPAVIRYRQEAAASGTYNLVHDWWLEAGVTTRLGKKIPSQPQRIINNLIGLQYRGDCLYIRFAVSKDYTTIVDLKPETSYMMNFNIPIF